MNVKAALVTPCLPNLPFHPSVFLGYGAAVLAGRFDVEVLDLNADFYFANKRKLEPSLDLMDSSRVVSDSVHLHSFHEIIENRVGTYYESIFWKRYAKVYVTAPSWFPMVPAEAVLRLFHAIARSSPETEVFFFGNSLGSWTDEEELNNRGVKTVHLNDLFAVTRTARPVIYDLLPNPVYENREKYLFDLLPFTLKHGCSWGQCRFCSLSRGWNSGYLERSTKAVIREQENIIEKYDPAVLVCRDHSMNGRNLMRFCEYFQDFKKPWCGQSRADLTEKNIKSLWNAGCRAIYFGLESGSDRMLSSMRKGITTSQMSRFIRTLHSNGILPVPSVIVGAPDERTADFEKTILFLRDHNRYLEAVNVYPFMATPGSGFTSQKKQPEKNAPIRLLRFIQECEDLGLKAIFGEQSIEYFIFNRMCKSRAP